ncbi:coiled-coil domain-containing protein 148-like [Polyodon spathula]|uniref:coiled-coil domain-containing protein 148-like n=1 Tax=Polyodon spathula TaxID=7913 RepID=UPI001B7E287A|nr:coiled-coil domain-containing protein 148-like [Polyodon spathula]
MARLEVAMADRKQAEEEQQKKEKIKCIQKRSLEKGLLQQPVKEKEVQALQQKQEEEGLLNILRNQVAVVAEFDPVRIMNDTEASKAILGTSADEAFVLQRPLF